MGFTAIPWADNYLVRHPEDAACNHVADAFRVVVEDDDGNRWSGRREIDRKDIDRAVKAVQAALDTGRLDPTLGNPMPPAYGSRAYQADIVNQEAELDRMDQDAEEFWGPRMAFKPNHRGIF